MVSTHLTSRCISSGDFCTDTFVEALLQLSLANLLLYP